MNNNIIREKDQEDSDCIFLVDKSRSGREHPWQEKKINSSILSVVYENLGIDLGEYYISKARRLEKCSNYLEFQMMDGGLKRLINGNFCRVRLCPMCGWRRSLKIYANMTKIMANMKDYQYVFLTLTQENSLSHELSQEVTNMMKAWNRFIGYKDVLKICKGWYRGLEITHNTKVDTYHPHFHIVLAVNKSYFKNHDYLTCDKWRNMWKKAMKLDYDPIVDIRKVKGDTAKAVAEIAKYTVKDKDYIDPEDLEMSMDAVKVLDRALDGRRLVAFGGIMKQLHKQLNLDDEEDGSLEKIDGEKEDDDSALVKMTYAWNTGYRNYIRIN